MIRRTHLPPLGVLILLIVGLWWLNHQPDDESLPGYSVHNRLPDAGGMADVLIPSLSRDDARREAICRAIAAEEDLALAFFFSTEHALRAHQAYLPSPDELRALQTGLLGELRDGTFRSGEQLYPQE